MPRTVIRCTKPEMVPKGDHWAILEFASVSTGTGYDSGIEDIQLYTAYTDQGEWEAAVHDKTVSRYGNQFVALRVTKAIVETKVVVR